MSDLINPLDSILSQASNLPESGALEPYAQRLNTKTSDVSVIMLDVSGSMAETVESGQRKIDVLRQAVSRPKQGNEIIITFGSFASSIPSFEQIPEPFGGTNMADAINIALPLIPYSTLIISDGLPDSKAQALNSAKKLSGIINTLFIGRDDDTEAKAFMRELAFIGCGRAQVCDISNPQMIPSLKTSISLLLPAR